MDAVADYGPLQGLARSRANTGLIISQWDQICRLTASLEARTVTPSAILRSLQRGPNPSSRPSTASSAGARAARALARDMFHGARGQLRQHYQSGQEDQLGALGLMVNIVVL